MHKIFLFLVLVLVISCSPKKENIEAKKKLINSEKINPYNPKVIKYTFNKEQLKANDSKALSLLLESPYRYTSEMLKAHKSTTNLELNYARINKVVIPEYQKVKPEVDKGASDRELPPVVTNVLSLKEIIELTHDPKHNFMLKLKNSMGYQKDIRWINQRLYINNNSDRYTIRKSIDNEHLTLLNEPNALFKKILKLIHYQIKVSDIEETSYQNQPVLKVQLTSSEIPYKKMETSNNYKVKDVHGFLMIDKENFAPLAMDIKIKWAFTSKKVNKKTNKPEEIEADFHIKRTLTQRGDQNIDIKTPEQEQVLNVNIPPSEMDAEEKILRFKKGHSALEKLRKEKAKRDKLLGITKKAKK